MTLWLVALITGAALLVIPIAILIGHFWRNGSAVVMGAAALVAFVIAWLPNLAFLSANGSNNESAQGLAEIGALLAVLGVLPLIAGWAIAVANAARARRGGWNAALIMGMVVTAGAFVYTLIGPGGTFYSDAGWYPTALQIALYGVASFAAPTMILAYALAPAPQP